MSDRRVDLSSTDDDSIELLRVVAIFTEEWRIGLLVALAVISVGLAIVAGLPAQFQSYAILLTNDASTDGPAGGLSALFNAARPSSTSLSLLASRTLKDDVIHRANLMSHFQTSSLDTARKELAARTTISPGPGTLTIIVRDRDAEVATHITAAYIEALQAMQESMTTAENDLQRRFFEVQVQHEKDALSKAEEDLEHSQESSGVVQMDTQTEIGLNAIANVRAQATVLQVRLAALLQSETGDNPEVRTLRSQVAQLQSQERELEQGSGNLGAGVSAPAGKLPGVNLEYQRKVREVRFHEALLSSLSNHFEDIRLGAATPTSNFEVLDPPIVPEFPTWPPRKPYRFLAIGCGVMCGFLAIALRLGMRRALRNPVRRAHLGVIRGHFVRNR